MMKKVFLTVSLALATVCLFAQTFQSDNSDRKLGTVSKSGQPILPKAGDFAIGINTAPFLNYAGNLLSGGTNTAPTFTYNGGLFGAPSVYAKYFLTDLTALRLKLNLGFTSDKTKTQVPEVGNPENLLYNSETASSSALGLTFGYEIRRGYGRLQGFFGPEVGVGVESGKTSYEYANSISSSNPVGSRTLSITDTPFSFVAGLGGFAGVEYFVAPKLSVGGELGLRLNFRTIGKTKSESEGWDGSKNVITETEVENGSAFNIRAAHVAALNVTFHF